MSKSTKPLLLALFAAVLLSLAAELALGWFFYTRLHNNNDTLAALGTQNDALHTELSALHEDFSGLQQTLSDTRAEIATLSEAGSGEDPGQEDNVRIAGEYVIQSTRPISDAYRSGDRSALNDKEKETLDMASAILDEIITPEMDAYEKEVAVYTWMTHNLSRDEGLLPVIPRTQADCDNPYGVLKYHNAVCVGYATTFRLFMQMLDIPCMVVHNTERYHSWDLVQLGDGWYHTDIYADVGQGNFSHFNMTDGMCGASQSWNTDFFPPANQFEECYAYRNSTEETDLYAIPAALRKAIDNQDCMLALRFCDPGFGETEAQIIQQMLTEVQNRIYASPLNDTLYFSWSWMALDQGWLLSVNLSWFQTAEKQIPEIPEAAYQKISDAVEDAFGDLESADSYWSWDYSNDGITPVG